MKRTLLVFVLTLAISALFAQIPRNKVVIEVGTGTWCPYCPGAAMGVDDLVANGFPVAPVENHNGDVFANQYSNARNTYYNITGYPTAFFDGGLAFVGGSATQTMYYNYLPRVQQRMTTPSPVDIVVYGSNSGQGYDILVTVTKVSNINGSDIRLHVCLTESNIVYAWQGQTHLSYVNRLMVPDQFGTVLDFSGSDVLEIPLTFSLQSGWVGWNMEIAAFVQTNSNKEIHQGFSVKLPFLQPPPAPLVAAFTTSNETPCNDELVEFTDQSTGSPTSWYWEFEGGTPATSQEQHPVVFYELPGIYDVALTVTKGTSNNTLLMEDYIDARPLTEVTFMPVEDQCLNYPPLALSHGYPEGGIYSGPGVEDGYFYPEVAGMGTHTLKYEYVNEEGCENFAEQTVVVDACTGIPENAGFQIITLPNPTTGLVKLSITGMQEMTSLRVINAMGEIIFRIDNIAPERNYSTAIDLSGQSNGIYYIHVSEGQQTYFRKVILNK